MSAVCWTLPTNVRRLSDITLLLFDVAMNTADHCVQSTLEVIKSGFIEYFTIELFS